MISVLNLPSWQTDALEFGTILIVFILYPKFGRASRPDNRSLFRILVNSFEGLNILFRLVRGPLSQFIITDVIKVVVHEWTFVGMPCWYVYRWKQWVLYWIITRVILVLKLHLVILLILFFLPKTLVEVRLAVLHACVFIWLLVLSAHILKDGFVDDVLSMTRFVIEFCFFNFLLLDHLNIFISADLWCVFTTHEPGCLGYLLHL